MRKNRNSKDEWQKRIEEMGKEPRRWEIRK